MRPKKRAKGKKATAKKQATRKPARRAPAPRQRRRAATRTANAPAVGRRLGEVAETVDVLMPELAARLAALEHMLIEKKLCGREDLLRARAFVDLRRGEV
jgi:hypothetical protein